MIADQNKSLKNKKGGEEHEENAGEDGDRARVAQPSEGQAEANFSYRPFEVHEH